MKNNSENIFNKDKDLQHILSVVAKTILDVSKDNIFIKDKNLKYITCNLPLANISGFDNIESMIGKSDFELFDEKLAKRYFDTDQNIINSGTNTLDYIEPFFDEKGQVGYVSTSKYILRDEDGSFLGILGIGKDITRDIRSRYHFQNEIKYIFSQPEGMFGALCIDIDDWQVVGKKYPQTYEDFFESVNDIDEIMDAACDGIHKDGRVRDFYKRFSPGYAHELYETGEAEISFEYLRELIDGRSLWVRDEIRFLINPENAHLCMMLSIWDIDKEKKEQIDLSLEATHDGLTGVLNRTATERYIRAILEESEETDLHAFFLIDIDNFKNVNDTLGHQEGDKLLIAFAEGMQESIRERDILGRLGGDEFIIFLKSVRRKADIKKRAEQLHERFNEICSAYSELNVSASIGISTFPKSDRTFDGLYEKSDRALYEAKGRGKNQIVYPR